MKRAISKSVTFFLTLLLLPAWLYASGNFPPLFDGDGHIIRTVQYSCPWASRTTFKYTHQVFEKMRDAGFKVPLTYNERVLNVKRIRHEIFKICKSIIINS